MRIPGFTPSDRPSDTLYLERRPGESQEEFEARMTAAAAAREGAPHGRDAYVRGRIEERHEDRRAAQETYAQGRRDEHHRDERRRDRTVEVRRRRGGFGLIGLVVVLVAAIGVVWLVLAAREGSFAAGGALVDQKIATVTTPARDAASRAVDRTGQAIENAGQSIENQGQRLREQAQ